VRIALGADHRGFALKQALAVWLASRGHSVLDCGTRSQGQESFPTGGQGLESFPTRGQKSFPTKGQGQESFPTRGQESFPTKGQGQESFPTKGQGQGSFPTRGQESFPTRGQGQESFPIRRVDYPDFAFRVAEAVQKRRAARGILICSTGIGMSMAANRVRGVRAALVYTPELARLSREHNDANVLCLGADYVSPATARRIVGVWLRTGFARGRHLRRLAKLARFG